ncbi:MAG: hypothetical protein ACUVRE_02815 [Thermoanaerobaculaceae bacterium]
MASLWSSRRLLFLELISVMLAACRSAAPVPQVSHLQLDPGYFRALYRMSCCGLRGLLLVVHHRHGGLSLETASGPAGAMRALWVTQGEIWERTKGNCVVRRPGIGLPLPGGKVLPLRVELFVPLLAGLLPQGGREVTPGLWQLQDRGSILRVQLAGSPSRWVKGWWAMAGNEFKLRAWQHRGRLPGMLSVRGAGLNLELELLEFHPDEGSAPPFWVGWPPCQLAP